MSFVLGHLHSVSWFIDSVKVSNYNKSGVKMQGGKTAYRGIPFVAVFLFDLAMSRHAGAFADLVTVFSTAKRLKTPSTVTGR
jgi:hypothetical protein